LSFKVSTSHLHVSQDLDIFEFELSKKEIFTINSLLTDIITKIKGDEMKTILKKALPISLVVLLGFMSSSAFARDHHFRDDGYRGNKHSEYREHNYRSNRHSSHRSNYRYRKNHKRAVVMPRHRSHRYTNVNHRYNYYDNREILGLLALGVITLSIVD